MSRDTANNVERRNCPNYSQISKHYEYYIEKYNIENNESNQDIMNALASLAKYKDYYVYHNQTFCVNKSGVKNLMVSTRVL